MNVSIKIDGFDKLDKKLHELPKKVAKKILKDGTKEGAKVIQLEAEKLLGLGKKYIGYAVKMKGSKAIGSVGPTKKKWYLLFRELGTTAKKVDVKNKKVLADKEKGIIFGKSVMLPAKPKKPFLLPAITTKKEFAISAMGKYMWNEIEKECR